MKAARGLGGYKAKSFKFEPQTYLQTYRVVYSAAFCRKKITHF